MRVISLAQAHVNAIFSNRRTLRPSHSSPLCQIVVCFNFIVTFWDLLFPCQWNIYDVRTWKLIFNQSLCFYLSTHTHTHSNQNKVDVFCVRFFMMRTKKNCRNKLFATLLFEWLSFWWNVSNKIARFKMLVLVNFEHFRPKCAAFFTMNFDNGDWFLPLPSTFNQVWYSASSVSSFTSKAFKNSLKSLKCCYTTKRLAAIRSRYFDAKSSFLHAKYFVRNNVTNQQQMLLTRIQCF